MQSSIQYVLHSNMILHFSTKSHKKMDINPDNEQIMYNLCIYKTEYPMSILMLF
jgi:hypothetical protein